MNGLQIVKLNKKRNKILHNLLELYFLVDLDWCFFLLEFLRVFFFSLGNVYLCLYCCNPMFVSLFISLPVY